MIALDDRDRKIINRLDILYPDKIVFRLHITDNRLYFKVKAQTEKKEFKNIEEYLKSIGFIMTRKSRQKSTNYDTTSLKLLNNEYRISYRELGKWFGLTPEAIRLQVNQADGINPFWQNEQLDERDKEEIKTLVAKKETVSEGYFLKICKNHIHDGKIAIFINTTNKTKLICDIPQDIYNLLYSNGYCKFDDEDFEVIKSLQKYAIDKTDEVRIPSDDTEFNRVINNRTSALNMSRIQYIEFLGYKYVNPKLFYTPEIWKEILGNYCIGKTKQVYVPCNDPLYHKLTNYASRAGFTKAGFIENLGFLYVKLQTTVNKEETEFIEKTLEKIKRIQGSLEKETTTQGRVLRSHTLAEEMKMMYFYKCQLCCPASEGYCSPLIEKEDGNFYVEVHHIKPVSEKDKVDDDSKTELDTWKNVVVVCSHHHKYLHYHHGGFSEVIKKDDGNCYFLSKCGDLLKIYTNHHILVE
jgi:hypothetical protein